MPRLFLVSLVRVCTRIRTPPPHFARERRNPFNLRARVLRRATRGETAPCDPLVSIAGKRGKLGQRAFENRDAPKKLPVYPQRVSFQKRFQRASVLTVYYCSHRNKRSDVRDSIYRS